MSLQDEVKTLLAANATLTTAFTGGIKLYRELGGLGLNRSSFDAAFRTTTDMRLKPILVIRERDQTAAQTVTDEAAQHRSYIQSLTVYFYADRADGFSTLATAQGIVYGLLHDKRVGSTRVQWRMHTHEERDTILDYACILSSVYDGHGVLTP